MHPSLREKVSARLSLSARSRPMSRPELCLASLRVVDSPDTHALRLGFFQSGRKGRYKSSMAASPHLLVVAMPLVLEHTPESRLTGQHNFQVDQPD